MVAENFLDTIEQLVPAEAPGLAVSEVYSLVDCWSRSHVKDALRTLEGQGRVASTLASLRNCTKVRLYRRAAENA